MIYNRYISKCPAIFQNPCFVLQDIAQKIDQHKEIIDQNNKSYYEMKKQKDALQNERK